MDPGVYVRHARLKSFPPAQMVYIIYRRLIEHGTFATYLWIADKVLRRIKGFSPPAISEVMPGLYVGGQQTRYGLPRMRARGITAVVNMRKESDDAARGVVLDHYLWLPITDDAAPALQDLERGSQFIDAQLSAGRGVYVHCASGVGRAPSLAAAYLVYTGKTPDAAWSIVRKGRPFIRPTPPQLDAIEAYARHRAQRGQPEDVWNTPLAVPEGASAAEYAGVRRLSAADNRNEEEQNLTDGMDSRGE